MNYLLFIHIFKWKYLVKYVIYSQRFATVTGGCPKGGILYFILCLKKFEKECQHELER